MWQASTNVSAHLQAVTKNKFNRLLSKPFAIAKGFLLEGMGQYEKIPNNKRKKLTEVSFF